MINRSSQTWVKTSILSTSTNTFTKNKATALISKGSNTTVKGTITNHANQGWDGDNISASALGIDDINFGTPLGIDEFGGITHFKNR